MKPGWYKKTWFNDFWAMVALLVLVTAAIFIAVTIMVLWAVI